MSTLESTPLTALSSDTKHLISTLLNPPKVVPASSGLLRDWRGFAQTCHIKGEVIPAIAADPNPFECILNFILKGSEIFTLKSLQDSLKEIERWDIYDDCESLLVRDAEKYTERLAAPVPAAQRNNSATESEVLTLCDQHYDAFVLYADEDQSFVDEMIEKLETENNLKLCLKDRDLLAGITFEHVAIMKLISERCDRLIIVISPEFLQSPANTFFINFAQANGIEKGYERKVIPCIYKNCELPQQLVYYSKIYYEKAPKYFWPKLLGSLNPAASSSKMKKPTQAKDNSKSLSNQENGIVPNGVVSKKDSKVIKKEDLSEESSVSQEPGKRHSSISWPKKPKAIWDNLKKSRSGESIQSQGPSTETTVLPESSTQPELRTLTEVPTLPEPPTVEPQHPSLDGLDPLSSLTNGTSTTPKSKKKKHFMKKVKALISKS